MNIRKLFEDIKSRDSFDVFWKYPKEKNLSMISSRLGFIKTPKELRNAIAQVCGLVFEKNEEDTFLYAEAQNLLKYTESMIEKVIQSASVGGLIDLSPVREEKEPNRFAAWEEAVIEKLCERYTESLLKFVEDIRVQDVEEHVRVVLFGK